MPSSKLGAERSADLRDSSTKLPRVGVTGPLSPSGNARASAPLVTRHLPVPVSTQVELIDDLSDVQDLSSDTPMTGRALVNQTTRLTTGRMPVVIPGAGKKVQRKVSASPVKTKHRMLLHAAVVVVLTLFVFTTLATVLPLGKDGQALGIGGLLQNLGVMNLLNSNSKNSALVAAQAATATAIMQQDGYDPGGAVSAQYNQSLGGVADPNDPFPYGQCTYWADYRYHQLTGYWIPWSGNAYQWAANSQAYPGWVVSSTPKVPSIVVFAPGVQYASPVYGHVAVVEAILSNGAFQTSNWNVSGYPFATTVTLTNYVGAGVQFVYHT